MANQRIKKGDKIQSKLDPKRGVATVVETKMSGDGNRWIYFQYDNEHYLGRQDSESMIEQDLRKINVTRSREMNNPFHPAVKREKRKQLLRVRDTLDEFLSDARKDENERAMEAFEVAIMLVDLELEKLS